MKKPLINFFLLASFAPFLMQCAAQTDVDELRYQLRIVNKKVEDMKTHTVSQLQKSQAAASGQVDQVEQEIVELRNQLEETRHLNERLKEQNKELEATITTVAQTEATKREEALKQFEEAQHEKELKLTEALNEKLKVQQESVKAIQQARLKDAERRAKEAKIAAELAKSRSKSASSALQPSGSTRIRTDQKKVKLKVDTPAASESQAKEVSQAAEKPSQPIVEQPSAANSSAPTGEQSTDSYGKAQRLYNSGNFKDALPLYEQTADNSAAGNSVEARFMMGECLFQMKEYDKAIMQYQKIISQHAEHAESPAAMLKQGMAFEKLADKDTAKVIYKKLLKKHGSSPEAAEAQEKLNKL